MNRAVRWICLALMLLASVSVAQQPVEQPSPPGKTEAQPGLITKSPPERVEPKARVIGRSVFRIPVISDE